MSLRLTNRATPKQIEMLKKLGYDGQGKYAPENLTVEEAAEIIDELLKQQQDENTPDYWDQRNN